MDFQNIESYQYETPIDWNTTSNKSPLTRTMVNSMCAQGEYTSRDARTSQPMSTESTFLHAMVDRDRYEGNLGYRYH